MILLLELLKPAVVMVLLGHAAAAAAPILATNFDVRAPPTNCPYTADSNSLPINLPTPLPPDVISNLTFLATKIDASVNNVSLPSVVASLVYNGHTIWSHGAGETKKGNGIKPDEHTHYRIGSVSKVFAVMQTYMLADDPTTDLTLDSSFAAASSHNIKFVNNFDPKTSLAQQQPTLRQMASQQAGLPREAPCDTANILLCNRTSDDMARRIDGKTMLISQPGSVPSYSNLAYSLLGRELAPAGDTFESWTQANILTPVKKRRKKKVLTRFSPILLNSFDRSFDACFCFQYRLFLWFNIYF